MNTPRCFAHHWFGLSLTLFGVVFAQSLTAQPIVNPLWEDSLGWESWWLDEDLTILERLGNPIIPLSEEDRQFPADVPATETDPDIFLHMEDHDYPERKYAGFWHDFYVNYDGYHSNIEPAWYDDRGNRVDLRRGQQWSLFNYDAGEMTPTQGQLWSSYSMMGGGIPGNISLFPVRGFDMEKKWLFANRPFISQSSGSSNPTVSELGVRYSPYSYTSIGWSHSEEFFNTKMAIVGGYLHRDLKPEILRNGWWAPTVMYLWRSTLPYDAPYHNEFFHQWHIYTNGFNSHGEYGNIEGIAEFDRHFDPHLHMKNMVRAAKEMTVVPPIVTLEHIETISGVDTEGREGTTGHDNITSHGYLQPFGVDFQVRVKVHPLDLQGMPVDIHWAMNHGENTSSVVDEGDNTYLITIPHNPDLPAGRTTLIVWGDNGVTPGNPAAINVSRSDDTFFGDNEPERDWTPTVTQPSGMSDIRVLPGETVTYDVFSYAPSGFPVSFIKWQGPGELDGNHFTWEVPADEPEGEHWVVIVGSDGTNGLTFSGSKAKVRVVGVKAVAAIGESVAETGEPVDFSAAASADKAGNPISSYLWDFGDGTTSALEEPTHAYAAPGVYRVSLTVTTPLGSDSIEEWIEVRPSDWAVAHDRGWDGSGLDSGQWTVVDPVTTELKVGDKQVEMKRAAREAPFAQLLSHNTFSPPLLIETQIQQASGWGGYFHLFDTAIGWFEQNAPLSIADYDGPEDTTVLRSLRSPDTGIDGVTLRAYVEDDPNHAGKLRISGSVRTPDGQKYFALDNRDPGDGRLGFVNPESLRWLTVRDFRVWQPDAGPAEPSIELLDDAGRVLARAPFSNTQLNGLRDSRLASVVEFPAPLAAGGSTERSLTIRNSGDEPLHLTASAPHVGFAGSDSGTFSVVAPPSAVIAPGGQSSFTIAYSPAPGQDQAVVVGARIANDDPERSHSGGFQVLLRGTPNAAASFYVEGRNVAIANGDDSPDPFDGTEFPSLPDGRGATQDFLLYRNGAGALEITDVTVTGDPAFSIDAAPRDTLEAYESSRLRIAFNPVGAGPKTALVTITTNDAEHPSFTFEIAGTGLGALQPEMRITGNDQEIPAGDSSPASGDGTDFGDVPFAPESPVGLKRNTFAIENTGETLLRLTGAFPQATLGGPDADAFFLYRDPAQAVHPGMEAEFIVAFQPQRIGAHSATLTIASDDPGTPAYSIDLAGNGVAAPVFEITDDRGWQIRNGDRYPKTDQNTDFGKLTTSGSIAATYRIVNHGSAPLQVTGATLSGSGAGSFSINAPSSVPAGATADLELTYAPATSGASEATVTIATDDPANPEWSFAIVGELSGLQPVGNRGVDRGLWEWSRFNGHAWADYDQDGDLDLLLTGSFLIDDSDPDYNPNLYGKTYLYTNDGSGQFTRSHPGFPDLAHSDADWADFDNDGDLDLLISGIRDLYTDDVKVTEVYRNDGGTFSPINAGLPGIFDGVSKWVDVNQDGFADVFLSGNIGPRNGSVTPLTKIYYNNGDGTFSDSGITFSESFHQPDVEWTDANGDGYPDLLIVGSIGSNERDLRVEFNNGDGTFTSVVLNAPAQATSASWGDANGDGLLDVLCNGGSTEDYVRAFLQNPDGSFTEDKFTDNATNAVSELQAGDLNGNGWADLALQQQSSIFYLSSAFNQATQPPGMVLGGQLDSRGTGALAIGDFNGDGVNDIWNSGRRTTSTGTSSSAFLFGQGAPNLPPAAPQAIAAEIAEDGASIRFDWDPCIDPETNSSHNVRYSIRVGTEPGLGDIVTGMGDADTGYRFVPRLGEIGGTTFRLHRELPPGTYYVAVQSVDAAFAASSWTETEFRIGDPVNPVDDSLTISEVDDPAHLDVLANDVVSAFGVIDSFTQPAFGSVAFGDEPRELLYSPDGYWGQHGPLTFSYTVRDQTEDGEVLADAQVTLTVDPALTLTEDLSPRTLHGIGLDAEAFAGRIRTSGDLQLQARAAGLAERTEDAALFAAETRSGDFVETLRLRDLSGTADARLGLMARAGTDPDAAFAQISAKPDATYAHNWRSAPGAASSAETDVTPTPAHEFPELWVRIARTGDSLTLSTSPDASNFTDQQTHDISGWGASALEVGPFLVSGAADLSAHGRMGDAVTAAFPDTATATEGQALDINVLANDSTQGGASLTQVSTPRFGTATLTAENTVSYNPGTYWGWDGDVTFDYTFEEDGEAFTSTVTVTVQPLDQTVTPLPGSFFDGLDHLGSTTGTGRRVSDSGLLQIATSGAAGLTATASGSDGISFAYDEALGDFKAIVRLRNLSGGDNARAGLMLREGWGDRVRTVWLGADALGQLLHQTRTAQGNAADAEQTSALPAMNFPDAWLRIERWRDTIRLFASPDGESYSQIGQTVTLSDLAGKVRIGLFTFGGGADAGSTADFTDYTLEIETEPLIANGGLIDGGKTHNLTALGSDDWVVWGQFGTGEIIRKSGGSGRIGELSIGEASTSEPLDSKESHYNELTWSDGDPVAADSAEQHGTVILGPVNDPASVAIPVGRAEGTVHVIFSVDNHQSHNMRGEATVLSSEPGVEPLTIAPLQTNQEGYNVRFDYVSAREDTVLTVRMAKILDDSSGEQGIFVPQALALSRSEIPGGDGGPPFFLPVNTAAPVAVDDAFTVVGGSDWLLDVAANDTDPDLWQGTPLLHAIATPPSHGSAAIQDGKVDYSPDPGFHGDDSFTYTATDGGFTSDPATVEVTVLDPGDPTDSDDDGLPDVFEIAAYGDLSRDGSDDFDDDGVTDALEFTLGRNAAGIDRLSLDFLDDFERGPGALDAHPGLWHFDPDAPTGEIKTDIGADASSGLELVTAAGETADLTLHLPEHWQAVSWKQFEAVLAPYGDDADTPEIDPEAAVAFYLTESGDLHIRDGADWYALGLSLDTEARHRFTVRQDYLAQTWHLWVNGDLVTDPPAAFANTVEAPSFFRITQGPSRSAVFDNIGVTAGLPAADLSGLLDYTAWQGDQTWNDKDSSPGADPNANNLPNLLEYGFGFTDPADGTHSYSTPMALDPDTGEVSFTFRRNRAAEDLSFTVETSPDLSPGSWTPVRPAAADVTVAPTGDPGTDAITVRLAVPGERLFVRLKVVSE